MRAVKDYREALDHILDNLPKDQNGYIYTEDSKHEKVLRDLVNNVGYVSMIESPEPFDDMDTSYSAGYHDCLMYVLDLLFGDD